MVSGPICKLLIHFQFIFAWTKKVVQFKLFFFLHASVQFCQHYLLKRLFLLYSISGPPWLKINW